MQAEPVVTTAVFGPMKRAPRKNIEKPSTSKRPAGGSESPQSRKTFARRTKPPGEVGLANETRPGLGTRFNEPFPGEPPLSASAGVVENSGEQTVAQRQHSSIEPNDKPLPREPQEQRPDSWAHEAERSTGVSGHTSG